ncbi:MAG: hypothetical protein QNI87_15220 [Erythrobacter sp.]|uniref:hypothetical protein n=1 Tax=Erythrobacter sp. TaxID=1042 RepID=UPI00260CBCEB|nr:hypothetical protein [Erythrobacter sp.]MDJ0979875.1 hypothetical protein [Erythrobacter sp.]
MKFRNIAMATAALSLATAPAIAQATFERASAPIEGESELQGSGVILGVLAAAAIIAGIVIAVDDGDDDSVSG